MAALVAIHVLLVELPRFVEWPIVSTALRAEQHWSRTVHNARHAPSDAIKPLLVVQRVIYVRQVNSHSILRVRNVNRALAADSPQPKDHHNVRHVRRVQRVT